MIEGIVTGVASGLIVLAIKRYWPEIHRLLTSPRGTQDGIEVTPCLKMLATDLEYWQKKLGERIFLLRLLPYEFTPKLFQKLGLESPRGGLHYNTTMGPYKSAIATIIREGGAGGVGYWDMSIFGRSDDPEIDRVTSYALRSMYFPIEPDPMDPDAGHDEVVNTSELGLMNQRIDKGLLLIGALRRDAQTAKEPVTHINYVEWKVGFAFTFHPNNQGFVGRWRPTCMRTTSVDKMAELSGLWVGHWNSLGNLTAEIGNHEARKSISIDVDSVASEQARDWRDFLENWFMRKTTEDV